MKHSRPHIRTPTHKKSPRHHLINSFSTSVIIGLHFLQLLTTRREKADDNARYPATRQKK
jgi:hypothetical protein